MPIKYVILNFDRCPADVRAEFARQYIERQGECLEEGQVLFTGDHAETAADIANGLWGVFIAEEGAC